MKAITRKPGRNRRVTTVIFDEGDVYLCFKHARPNTILGNGFAHTSTERMGAIVSTLEICLSPEAMDALCANWMDIRKSQNHSK